MNARYSATFLKQIRSHAVPLVLPAILYLALNFRWTSGRAVDILPRAAWLSLLIAFLP